MDVTFIDMDKACIFLERVINWANTQEKLNIVFARKATCQIVSRPRPLIEFYLIDWDCQTTVNMLNQTMTLLPGGVFISNAHVGYTSTSENWNYWCVSINVNDDPEFDDILGTPLMVKAKVRNFGEISEHFNQIISEYGRDNILSGIRLKTYVLKLLICLLDNIGTGKNVLAYSLAVQMALSKIHTEYSNPSLGLPDLAKAVHLSNDHFGRVFREQMGITPIKYLTDQRIKAACELIQRDNTLSIKEVAYQVGYRDALHFSRMFRNQMKMSPSDYHGAIYEKHNIQ